MAQGEQRLLVSCPRWPQGCAPRTLLLKDVLAAPNAGSCQQVSSASPQLQMPPPQVCPTWTHVLSLSHAVMPSTGHPPDLGQLWGPLSLQVPSCLCPLLPTPASSLPAGWARVLLRSLPCGGTHWPHPNDSWESEPTFSLSTAFSDFLT